MNILMVTQEEGVVLGNDLLLFTIIYFINVLLNLYSSIRLSIAVIKLDGRHLLSDAWIN